MKRIDNNVIIVAAIAVTALLYFLFASFSNEKNTYNWNRTYQEGEIEPYDLGLFKALLKNRSTTGFSVIEHHTGQTLSLASNLEDAAYIFAGRYYYLSKENIDSILNFVSKGHKALIITEGVPDTLMEVLCFYSKAVTINRFDEAKVRIESYNKNSQLSEYYFNYRSFKQKTDQSTDWYYLDEKKQLEYSYGGTGNRYVRLNSINGHTNYAKFKVGSGYVYIHTSPILFTNYALVKDTGFIYLNEVFNEIGSKNIFYDLGSREYHQDSEKIKRQSDSPLSYILKQASLRWAWYLFLLASFLYFVFRAKRKQRIIPVLEKKKNTSIGFTETLSGLFYSNANHKQMAETKMNLFLFFIRRKLNISTFEVNQETLRLISVKSNVPEITLRKIFDYYHQVISQNQNNIKAENLLELQNRIAEFYTLYLQKNK